MADNLPFIIICFLKVEGEIVMTSTLCVSMDVSDFFMFSFLIVFEHEQNNKNNITENILK